MVSVTKRVGAVWWLVAGVAGCAVPSGGDEATEEPGVVEQALAPFEAGGWNDSADLGCQVVLRTVRRSIGDCAPLGISTGGPSPVGSRIMAGLLA